MSDETEALSSHYSTSDSPDDVDAQLHAFSLVVNAMQRLSQPGRAKLLNTVSTFFGITQGTSRSASASSLMYPDAQRGSAQAFSDSRSPAFSEDRAMSPKEFMMNKRPQSDIDRVACLAYYLTHYRDMPHFKTFDLSKLNTEAAQIKLSNPAKAVDNATQTGLLVPASRGTKQISAMGEVYVQALPDRTAAKQAIAQLRLRRKSKRGKNPGFSSSLTSTDDEAGEG